MSGRLHRAPRGLSLVETMVGISVGLFVVAGAVAVAAGQLSDNRKLMLELQIQQDLRVAMDIMTRQLRRTGALSPEDAQVGLGNAGGRGGLRFLSSEVALPLPSRVDFSYVYNAGDAGPYGFSLLPTGVVRSIAGPGGNQELTDARTVRVTALTFTPNNTTSVRLPCPKLCPGPGAADACWPRVVLQNLVIEISAQARNDPSIRRTLTSEVRVRNDRVIGDVNSDGQFCPS